MGLSFIMIFRILKYDLVNFVQSVHDRFYSADPICFKPTANRILKNKIWRISPLANESTILEGTICEINSPQLKDSACLVISANLSSFVRQYGTPLLPV